jgi:hypothetical protein
MLGTYRKQTLEQQSWNDMREALSYNFKRSNQLERIFQAPEKCLNVISGHD